MEKALVVDSCNWLSTLRYFNHKQPIIVFLLRYAVMGTECLIIDVLL